MVKKRVIPDVHVALHFRRFDEIDWRRLVGADAVVLVVTPPFMAELDDKKNGSKGALQKRARNFSTWLGEQLDAGDPCFISDGVELVFLTDEPELSVDFAAQRLVPTNLDDRYIACIIAERDRNAESEVVFVTGDSIAKAKAKAKSLKYVEPPADAKLGDEPDEHEKELAEVKRKLAGYLSASSDLRLSFLDDKEHMSAEIAVPQVVHSELQNDVRRHTTRFDLLYKQHSLYASVEPFAPQFKPREQYVSERREWLKTFRDMSIEHALMFLIPLVLSNRGRAPAKHVQIDLTLPNGVSVAARPPQPLPEAPRMLLPRGPLSAWKKIGAKLHRPGLASQLSLEGSGSARLVVDRTDRQRVRIDVDDLNHHAQVSLPPVRVAFATKDAIKSFSVAYRVLSATQPDPATGDLHIKLMRKDVRLTYPDEPDEDFRARA